MGKKKGSGSGDPEDEEELGGNGQNDEGHDQEEKSAFIEKNPVVIVRSKDSGGGGNGETTWVETKISGFQEMTLEPQPQPICKDIRGSKTAIDLGWKRYLGVIYTLLSTNSFSLSSTIMKKYSHIHPFVLGTWAFPVAALVSVPFLMYAIFVQKKSTTDTFWPIWKFKKVTFFILFRAIASSGISYSLILSFKYISVADTRTIMAATVITVFFFGWLCLGEKCGIVPIIIAILAICGIGVISRPPMLTGNDGFDTDTLTGVSLAFVGLILATAVIITVRHVKQVHHGMLNFILYTYAFGQSLILAAIFNKLEMPASEMDAVAICSVGLFKAVGNLFLVLALQAEEAGIVALVRTSEVIFTFYWQYIIIGKAPDSISILGASLVLTGVIAVTLRKWVSSLPQENRKRRKLAFLLL